MDHDDVGIVLRSWRRASGLKQKSVAGFLGVSQAAISRWEAGLDCPSPVLFARIRDLIGDRGRTDLDIDLHVLSLQPGLRALVDIDGWRLLGFTPSFEAIWPELRGLREQRFADYLIGQTAELYQNTTLVNSVKAGEIKLISGVTDRHLEGFGDNAFRHHWAAVYRKAGARHVAEITFEACDPEEAVGLRRILRVDEIR